MSGTKVVKKISVTTCYGKVSVSKESPEKSLLHVVGLAKGYEPGETSFGPFTRFRGQFFAVNMDNGEESASGALFIPGGAFEGLLKGALDAANESSGGEAMLKVNFVIHAMYSEKSSVGYEYRVETREEIKPVPIVEELLRIARDSAAGLFKQLPNPEPDAKPNPEPDAKPEAGKAGKASAKRK